MGQQHYSPWAAVAGMPHINIEIRNDVEGDFLGWWDADTSTIYLNGRQSRRQMRCTLAHELEHARAGDECTASVSSILDTRQEIAAANKAARKLISLDDLVQGLLWSQDEFQLAEELNVDVETVSIRLMTLTPAEHAIISAKLWLAERGIA